MFLFSVVGWLLFFGVLGTCVCCFVVGVMFLCVCVFGMWVFCGGCCSCLLMELLFVCFLSPTDLFTVPVIDI